jgi:1-acyl-sn-glycerol-3-phosphate acyltransferase
MAVTGLEHIPTDGPVLLVARHYHHFFDGVVLLVSIPRPIHILVTLDWAKNSYARRLVTLATTMVRWPVVLRSDAPRACVNRIAHGGGRSSQPPPSDALNVARSVILSRFSLRVASSLCFPKVIPILTPPKTRAEFLPFKAGFASIAAAAEKRSGS